MRNLPVVTFSKVNYFSCTSNYFLSVSSVSSGVWTPPMPRLSTWKDGRWGGQVRGWVLPDGLTNATDKAPLLWRNVKVFRKAYMAWHPCCISPKGQETCLVWFRQTSRLESHQLFTTKRRRLLNVPHVCTRVDVWNARVPLKKQVIFFTALVCGFPKGWPAISNSGKDVWLSQIDCE